MNGVLVIDKPAGMTSHDVVNRVRRIMKEKSVGHLGTLDPMATGVLPLVLGRLTRLAQFYTGSEKAYSGEIRFGFATTTYDAEGDPVGPVTENVSVSLDELRRLAAQFHGHIQQIPPRFSAKKIAGVPAYKMARKQQEVELQPVEIEVKEFDIQSSEGDRARFFARVSSGTYIRSIAHDMGQRLGCGAHLTSLRRTVVGEFNEADARTLEELESVMQQLEPATQSGMQTGETAALDAAGLGNTAPLQTLFVHPRRLLPAMPAVTATDQAVSFIRNGRAVNLPEMSRAPQIKVFRGQSDLIAIATRIAGTLFQPKVVFAVD